MPPAEHRPLLSVCIPTYNRPAALGRCLRAIAAAADAHPLRYEVHVQDNASPQDNRAVFDAVAAGRPGWYYRRNPANLGARVNIWRCTERAAGQYLIICGDDDELLPDAFAILARVLATAAGVGARAALLHERLGPGYARPGGAVFRPGFAWLRQVGVNVPGFITALVFRTDYWRGFRYEQLPRAEVRMPHLLAFLEACDGGPVVGCSVPLYTVGAEEDTGSPAYGFYPMHALVDCFEYPAYTRLVLDSRQSNGAVRRILWLRYLKYFRVILPKVLFLRYNRDYYRLGPADFRPVHGRFFYWPAFAAVLWAVFRTRPGGWLARRVWRTHPPIPADFRELY